MADNIMTYLKEQGLGDAEVLEILGLWAQEGRLADLEEEFARTGELQDTLMPGGRSLGGRIYVSANPLEFASTLGQRLWGDHQRRELEAEREGLLTLAIKCLEPWGWTALRARLRRPQPPALWRPRPAAA